MDCFIISKGGIDSSEENSNNEDCSSDSELACCSKTDAEYVSKIPHGIIHKRYFMYCIHLFRPGAHQSSKAAFGKSAFAKTCYNVLSFVKDTTWRTPIDQKEIMLSCTF